MIRAVFHYTHRIKIHTFMVIMACPMHSMPNLHESPIHSLLWHLGSAAISDKHGVLNHWRLFSAYGNVYYLVETNLYPLSGAELYIPYRNTAGWCMELFYMFRGSDNTTLSVFAIGIWLHVMVHIVLNMEGSWVNISIQRIQYNNSQSAPGPLLFKQIPAICRLSSQK